MRQKRRLLMALAASGAWLCSAPGALGQNGGPDCLNADPVTPGTYTAIDGGGAGASNVCFGGGGTNAAWFSYTPAANGLISITSSIDPACTDTRLSIYSGTCAGLVCEDSNDDDGGSCGSGYTSTINGFAVTAGTTYFIEWDDRWTPGFSFDWSLTFSAPPPPPNGGPDCLNAEAVTPGNYTALSPVAGNGASLGCFGSGATHATWYSYLATADGTIDVSACGSGEDTRLSVYDGTCGSLNCLASGDDNCGLSSEVLGVPVISGTTYFIEFDDRWSPGDADWTLTYNAPPPPAPGEDCANAVGPIGVAVDEISCVNTLVTSGNSQDGPAASCSSGSGATPDDDVWLSFVAPANGNKLVITTTGISNTDWVMEIWDDCPGSGAPIACSDDVNGLMPEIELCQFQYTAGNTYYIRAWTWTSGGSGSTMDLCVYEDVACPAPPANDNCANAASLTLGPDNAWCPTNEIAGTTTNATPEGGNGVPTCDLFGTINDVWYTITTGPTTAGMTVNVNDVSGSQEFAIYEAFTCGSGGTSLACESFGTSATVNVLPSSTYYVRVWANPGNEGDFNICANEVCVAPTATTAIVDDCGNGQFFIDVDVTSLGNSASVDITTDFVGDTEPTGVGTGVTQIGPYPSGTTVVITLVHDSDASCDAVLPGESFQCPPPNDDCSNAIPVACNSLTAGSTIGATSTPDQVGFCGTSDGAPGVWYTVNGFGGLMQARTCGSGYDTKLRVYEGTCGALVCIDGNDDSCGLQSEVSWTGTTGTTYYVLVFGFSSATGNFTLEVICGDQNPPCTDNTVELEINTDGSGNETSYEIIPVGIPTPVCSGSGFPDNAQVLETCCLPDGCYRLRVLDSFGDGIAAPGGYVLRDGNGNRIIDADENGNFGSESAISFGGAFCLPLGTDRLIASQCDKEDFLYEDYFIASENPAVTAEFGVNDANSGYQFWMFDPHGSYFRRVFYSHANPTTGAPAGPLAAGYLRPQNLVTLPPPVDIVLNMRVRSRVNGVFTNFGPACRIQIVSALPACPETQLIDDVNNPNFSCGVTRSFGGSDKIYAQPLAGATNYRFRFENIGEGYLRNIAGTSAARVLNWVTLPLQDGVTYDVTVQASFDGGANYCAFGDVCQVTISNPPSASLRDREDTAGSLAMWPNPNRGDQLYLTIDELPNEEMTVNVDIYDLFGKRVAARTLSAQGGMLNTVISLDGQLAAGMYMVNITAGDQLFTERLIIE